MTAAGRASIHGGMHLHHGYVPPVEFEHIVTSGETFVNDSNTPKMHG
jgi:hypothetical protein